MNKLRYIPGDLVYQKDDEGHWNIRSLSALNLALINYKDIKPIPLTHEILEKNGWKKLYEKFFEKNVNNIRLTIEFSENIYIAINRIFIMEIHYIHELQHLLFGLGINHKMEV